MKFGRKDIPFCLFILFIGILLEGNWDIRGRRMIERVMDNMLASMDGEFSIVLKDMRNNRLCYEKEAERQVPAASTIKILIMIEAFKRFLLGTLEPDAKLKVKAEDKVDFSLLTLMRTEEFTVMDIILLMMSISDNTATNVLIDILGMESINDTGEAFGLKGTRLQRKMMDFEAAERGLQNLTTPRDMLSLMDKLYYKEILTPESCAGMLDIMCMGASVSRDFMIRELPVGTRVAHKTGELEGLNHDIGIVYTDCCDYALGVFATGLKDNISGREYIARISKAVFDHIHRLGGIK